MADVQSIKRAFDILRVVAQGENSVGLSEIARQVDLPKSTVSRLLATLESQGAIKRLLETDGSRADSYQIGDGIVTLAANVSYPRTLIAVARPYLQELSQLSGETISLGIPDGDMGKTIEQIHSQCGGMSGESVSSTSASSGSPAASRRICNARSNATPKTPSPIPHNYARSLPRFAPRALPGIAASGIRIWAAWQRRFATKRDRRLPRSASLAPHFAFHPKADRKNMSSWRLPLPTR